MLIQYNANISMVSFLGNIALEMLAKHIYFILKKNPRKGKFDGYDSNHFQAKSERPIPYLLKSEVIFLQYMQDERRNWKGIGYLRTRTKTLLSHTIHSCMFWTERCVISAVSVTSAA